MLDHLLIRFGAPTLAGIKTANLFNDLTLPHDVLTEEVARVNKSLKASDVYLTALTVGSPHNLLFLYRRKRIQALLAQPAHQVFLANYGYVGTTPEETIAQLRKRLAAKKEFPHEVGLFLDYPLADVAGFIQHQGRHCKCCGCWKVYGNTQKANQLFTRYERTQEIYHRLYAAGRTLEQLTVSA